MEGSLKALHLPHSPPSLPPSGAPCQSTWGTALHGVQPSSFTHYLEPLRGAGRQGSLCLTVPCEIQLPSVEWHKKGEWSMPGSSWENCLEWSVAFLLHALPGAFKQQEKRGQSTRGTAQCRPWPSYAHCQNPPSGMRKEGSLCPKLPVRGNSLVQSMAFLFLMLLRSSEWCGKRGHSMPTDPCEGKLLGIVQCLIPMPAASHLTFLSDRWGWAGGRAPLRPVP